MQIPAVTIDDYFNEFRDSYPLRWSKTPMTSSLLYIKVKQSHYQASGRPLGLLWAHPLRLHELAYPPA